MAPEQWRSPEALRELLLRKPQVLDLPGSSGSCFFQFSLAVRCELRNIYRYLFCPGDFWGKVSFRNSTFSDIWNCDHGGCLKKDVPSEYPLDLMNLWGWGWRGFWSHVWCWTCGWQGTPRVGFFQLKQPSLSWFRVFLYETLVTWC